MPNDLSEDQPALPANKEELLGRIQRDWSALLRFLEDKDPAQLVCAKPGCWSVKDNLAHLAFWEKFLLLHHLRQTPAGLVLQIDASELRQLNEDQLNHIIWVRSQGTSLPDVLEDLRQTHQAVMAELEAVEFETLRKHDRIDTLIERPILESVVCNTCEHYLEHLKTMEREVSS